ncbi:hypothetical protein ACOXXX_08220 [Thalassococcus sp. BH17M4-6]|uniref:hypothetical protein n=1 Tax=Thalassococcus sp. BH17M4-6 TaxID=3413148 RepID=UPI003BE9F55D
MAYFDLSDAAARRPGPAAGLRFLRRLFDTPFDRRSREIARQLDALRALSDAELAQRGLARDEIALHVFGCRQR